MVVGTLSYGAKRSNSEDPVDAVHSGIVVYCFLGTSPLVQKGHNQCDAVCTGCSGIVVYGGEDIILMQKGETRRHSGCSNPLEYRDIWWWGHCLWLKKGQTSGCSHTVDRVHNGCSTQCL